ncbi:hypothetical protein ACP70R_019401 [Stipagrostis hirtigluma subsp. patula]
MMSTGIEEATMAEQLLVAAERYEIEQRYRREHGCKETGVGCATPLRHAQGGLRCVHQISPRVGSGRGNQRWL